MDSRLSAEGESDRIRIELLMLGASLCLEAATSKACAIHRRALAARETAALTESGHRQRRFAGNGLPVWIFQRAPAGGRASLVGFTLPLHRGYPCDLGRDQEVGVDARDANIL